MSARFSVKLPFGAQVTAPGQVRFRVWAPGADAVAVDITGRGRLPMRAEDAAAPAWYVLETECDPGTLYRYVFQTREQGEVSAPDPASRGQAGDVFDPSVVVDPEAFLWQHTHWQGRPWEETVLYELHPGAMGGFAGIQQRLAELAELGITAIELMPVAEFPGAHNWGYDGVLPFAPDASYGTPDQLKALIDTAHGLGMMVFLDVVYNHFGPDGNYLHSYAPDFFRHDMNTLWGATIDFRRPEVADFFTQNALYWLQEYRFDGLRLDAVHAICEPDWLVALGQRVRAEIGNERHVHLVLEHDGNAAHLLGYTAAVEAEAEVAEIGQVRERSSHVYDAQWNDDAHHVLHVLLTGEHSGYYSAYAEAPAEKLARCLQQGFVYQGEVSPYSGEPRGEPSADLPPTAFVNFLQNHDQIGNRAFGERLTVLAHPLALHAAQALILLAPQVPMLFMGEEFCAVQPFLYFTSHRDEELVKAVREGRRREFARFPQFADPKLLEQIPDPNSFATFVSSIPEPGPAPGSAACLRRVAELLHIRKLHIVPYLRGAKSLEARAIGPKAVHARWQLANGSVLNITVNLDEAPLREALDDLARPAGADVLFDSGGALEALAAGSFPGHAILALREPPAAAEAGERSMNAALRQPAASAAPELIDPVSKSSPENDLYRLAERAGIAVHWIDAYDQPQVVADEALQAILEALGLPCATASDCRDSLAQLDREHAVGYLPPLLTGVQYQPVALPAHSRLHGLSCRVELDNGARLTLLISSDLNAPPTLPPIDVPGYHRLLVAGHILTLAIAPPRCYTIADALAEQGRERGWALAAQVYGLRSDSLKEARKVYGDGGIGHFGALAELASMAAHYGAAALAMSPVHAMFAADPGRSSPYSPSSRLFLNPFLIDPAGILGADAQAQVLAEGGSEMIAAHERLQQSNLIDWARAGAHRMTLLRRLHALFRTEHAGDATQQAAFAAFQLEGGAALRAHALFEAYSHHLSSQGVAGCCDWRQWGEAGRHPDTPEMQAFAAEHAGEIDFHLFLQWQAARQLAEAQHSARVAGMAIGLIADLAVGADNGGSQAWSHQDEIAAGLTVGAPPDRLAPQGQNWGLGAFSPLALRRTGYRAYLSMLRATFAQGGGVRIDHVLGLNRLWLVPQGREADAGAYVSFPQQDMLRLIALESWRYRTIVIGEDLGTVPPGFDTVLDEAGVSGIRVLWFQREKTSFLPPSDWSRQAIAVTTTHDLPTVAGWWSGADLAWRERLGQLEEGLPAAREQRREDRSQLWQGLVQQGCASGPLPEAAPALKEGDEESVLPVALDDYASVVDAALDYVAATPASLAVVPVEDILGLTQQPNLPGMTEPHPNWRRRLPEDTPQLFSAYAAKARLERLRRVRGGTAKEI